MKINTDVLVTKIEAKKRKDTTEQYLMISFLDINGGDVFDVIEKDIEMLVKIQPMTKYNMDLQLSSSKYGLKLSIINLNKELGGV